LRHNPRTKIKIYRKEVALSNNLAKTYIGIGQHRKAIPLQERALSITKDSLGIEHPGTAVVMVNLAYIYAITGEYDKSLQLRIGAIKIAKEKLGIEHPDTARILNHLADSYVSLAHYDKAIQYQEEALEIFEKFSGHEHPNTAQGLNNLALTYIQLAQYRKALPLQSRALEINLKNFNELHEKTAISLNNIALTYRTLGEYEKALKLQERSLKISEKVLGINHPFTITTSENIASIYISLDQPSKALSLQQRALEINKSIFGIDHLKTANSLSNLARTFSILGNYAEALHFDQKALDIYKSNFGSDHPEISRALINLAGSYLNIAQYNQAIELLEQSLKINQAIFGEFHTNTEASINNLASALGAIGRHENALTLHKRSLFINEALFGSDHPNTVKSLNNLALAFNALGKPDLAMPFLTRALIIDEKGHEPENIRKATSLNNIGSTLGDMGHHDSGLIFMQRSLSIIQKILGSDHPKTAISLGNLAHSLLITGNPEIAIVFLKSAINIYQKQREQVASIGGNELASYTQSVAGTYRGLATALTENGRLAEAQLVLDMLKEDEQFEFVRRSANADPRRSRMAFNATEQAWTQRYRQVSDRLAALGAEEVALQKQAKLGLTAEQQQRQKALAADLAVARQAFQAFLDELRSSFAQKGPARTVEVVETSQKALRDLQSLLKGLGDDAVLLQYYITDDKVGMLLTTPGVQLARSSQVNAKDLNRQIAEFRRLLRDPKSNPLPAAQALYQLLLAPVAQDLAQAGAKTVMLSLDGALRYVPFAALHDGQQYLAQKWNLPMYTSVTKDKLRDAVSQEWQAAALGLTQAVGEFDALPAVRAEMRSIVKDGRTGVLPGEVHLDKAFSAARLKDVSQRPFQLLHVASHFRFSPGTEVNSFLLLGDGQQLTLGDIRTQNYRFDQVDLLTLSACDTGLGGGRDAQGREIEGFGVIAQQQGAKAVLATLWPVADQSTALLMADLYKQRQSQRLTKIEALRQAQLGLMAQPRYAHPFYWAPFILMGNWK
jgi:CHAT domain-containing protein